MSKDRLGARPDFDEWASTVVATVKKHRSRSGVARAQDLTNLRRWVSRMLTKIAA